MSMPLDVIGNGSPDDPGAVAVKWSTGDGFAQVGVIRDVTVDPEDREIRWQSVNSHAAMNDLLRSLRRARGQSYISQE